MSEWNGPALTLSVSLSDETWPAVLVLRGQRETIAVESTVSQLAEGEKAVELSDDEMTDNFVEAIIIEFLERWAAAVPPII